MNKIADYLKSTKGELKHVSWPGRREIIIYTSIVIVISIVVAALLGFFDYIFSQMIKIFFV